MANPKIQSVRVQPQSKISLSGLIPFLIVAVCLAVAALHLGGVINISGFLNPNSENYLNLHNVLNPTTGPPNQNPIKFSMLPNPGPMPDKSETRDSGHIEVCEDAVILDAENGEVGKPYKNKLEVSLVSGESTAPFTFFIFDSLSGLPPPGITLHSDGVLSGVPTKAGSYELEVCAENEDAGDCFCIRIFIRPRKEEPIPNPDCFFCPTHSCDTGECCCEIKNKIRTSAVLTFDCCERCPSDTHEVGKDVKTEGGPYKICQCNEC